MSTGQTLTSHSQAADCVFTYFQDIFGQTHYLFFYGDNSNRQNDQLAASVLVGISYDV